MVSAGRSLPGLVSGGRDPDSRGSLRLTHPCTQPKSPQSFREVFQVAVLLRFGGRMKPRSLLVLKLEILVFSKIEGGGAWR